MDDVRRVLTRVRRRIALARFVRRLELTAAVAAGVLLVAALSAHLLGGSLPLLGAALAALGAALVAAALWSLLRPVSSLFAASEADRIYETREVFSTADALEGGRTEDPLGFKPVLLMRSRVLARRAPRPVVRQAIPLKLRRWSLLTPAFLAALLLLPLLPGPAEAEGADDGRTRRERESVEQALRKLERKAARTVNEATKAEQAELKELAQRIREQVSKLAGERPRRAPAVAQLAKLEREAKDAARRFAGMKPRSKEESDAEEMETLRELARALEKMAEQDPAALKERLSSLWDKLNKKDASGLTPGEAAKLSDELRDLGEAMRALNAATESSEMMRELMNSLGSPEKMAELANALDELRKKLEERGLTPEEQEAMEQALRDYKMLQMSEEEIEQLLKSIEELKKLLESGAEISFCKGGLGGLSPLGMGLRLGPGLGKGRTSSNQPGMLTGGQGQGRGGQVPEEADGRQTAPDMVPGQLDDQGKLTLIRSVRSLPDPNADPGTYERLVREASAEAEEALRRGDIPRRYRGYVRRFFSGPEDE